MKPVLALLLVAASCASTMRADERNVWRPSAQAESETAQTWLHFDALTYIPSRLLDVLDVFRADVGAGFGTGIVLRATPWAQVGWRHISPVMLRVGLFGRKPPILVEHESELFAGPVGLISSDREPTAGEVGMGVDLVFGGIYAGVCFDELADLLLGLVALDFKGDDLGR